MTEAVGQLRVLPTLPEEALKADALAGVDDESRCHRTGSPCTLEVDAPPRKLMPLMVPMMQALGVSSKKAKVCKPVPEDELLRDPPALAHVDVEGPRNVATWPCKPLGSSWWALLSPPKPYSLDALEGPILQQLYKTLCTT